MSLEAFGLETVTPDPAPEPAVFECPVVLEWPVEKGAVCVKGEPHERDGHHVWSASGYGDPEVAALLRRGGGA